MPTKHPAEILTIANHILGTGQLSLAKFLFITAEDSNAVSTQNVQAYFKYVLERIDLTRDIHFYTNTTIDTLDYSGTSINSGSKVVFAAYGNAVRELATEVPAALKNLKGFENPQLAIPGVVVLSAAAFENYIAAAKEMAMLNEQLTATDLHTVAMIVIADDASFTAASLNNFLWVSFTRCNPSHDIYGISSFTQNKHWGCNGPVVMDARVKPHHAPPVMMDTAVEKKINRLFDKGGSLYKMIKE
jgi:4-hydroxy-3-polyprenylbenzoate decarboxylase